MDAQTILRIKPALTDYLHEFDDCFGRRQTRGHLTTYVQGQLGDLPRKSVEPMADAAGVPPRTLQEFLSLSRWDQPRMRDRLQRRVASRHAHEHSVGLFDETSFLKKGDKTACVQRQHCGAAGKTDNCVVSVHLGYATPDPGSAPGSADGDGQGFHTLLDGELYLPQKTWDGDRDRCRQAGIPDQVAYRPKWRIALEQYRRALANGVRLRWLTFDEGYGGKPPFLRELDGLGQDYVAEVPADFRVWTRPPGVLHRRHGRDLHRLGRPRQFPRLKVKHNPTATVQNVLRHSPLMADKPWVMHHVKDASKGPMVWEVKPLPVYLKDEHGLPTRAHHLLVARNVLKPEEVKYFISNAGEATAVGTLLLVAFSRHKIERMFEDSKMELGLDHFEVRRYQSVSRHLLLSCVSHLFLAEFRLEEQKRGGETSGSGGGEKKDAAPDDQPTGHGHGEAGAAVGAWRTLFTPTSPSDRRAIDDNAATQRACRPQPPQTNDPAITRAGDHVEEPTAMLLA